MYSEINYIMDFKIKWINIHGNNYYDIIMFKYFKRIYYEYIINYDVKFFF